MAARVEGRRWAGVWLVLWLTLLATCARAAEGSPAAYPFFPSLIDSVSGKAVTSVTFLPPSQCRGCHGKIFDQWNGSMHSNAFRDPIFMALWTLGAKEAPPGTERLCAGCHTGIGTLAEEVKLGADGVFHASPIAEKGVQCHLCHSVVRSTAATTPTGMPENGSIVLDPGMTMRGPYTDATPMWHQAAYSELHTRAEFCANCHNVFHPANHFPIESTYNEWRFSVYAQKGIVCQDCHMMSVEKSREAARTLTRPTNPGRGSAMGPDRSTVFDHDFVGANFTVTALLGADDHAAMARERLQSAATLSLTLPESAKGGDIARLRVRVTNVGAGHNLPTSLTEVRQMWLDVTVADAKGRVLYRSGALDAKGDLGPEAVSFGAHAADQDGKPTIKPWEMVRFDYNTTIPAKGYAEPEFAFLVPADAVGPLSVKSVLRYRGYPQAVANALLGDKAPTLPIVDMAHAEGSFGVK